MLSVETDKGDTDKSGINLQHNYDFANSMISFDKMGEFMPESASERMPEKRLKRINEVLINLTNTEQTFDNKSAAIFVNSDHKRKFLIKDIFKNAYIRTIDQDLFEKAITEFEIKIYEFTKVITAIRIAELELKDKYDEVIHNEYFSLFHWRQLTDKELSFFTPFIVITNTEYILGKEYLNYSRILSNSYPLNILAINQNKSNGDLYKQELSALSIAQRSAYIFQGAGDKATLLNKSFDDGLISGAPALWHLLIPPNSDNEYLKITSVIESRWFPEIIYDQNLGKSMGSRFDISSNSQAEKHWPEYSIEIIDGKEKAVMNISFTVADEQIIHSSKADELEIIPPEFYSEDLIPLTDYLEREETNLIGKIPFTWVVDEDNFMQKAAIPFTWLPDCKERLEFWQFIQELGGVNSYHVNRALEKAKELWSVEKDNEFNLILEDHKVEIEKVRNEAAGQAMDKLVSVLLDIDNVVTTPLTKPKINLTEKIEQTNGVEIKNESNVQNSLEEILISSEPWVESIRCTTCNDCTDKLPLVFKYNSDKQAYIHDATKATFAQLLAVAEKCPAKCIHTGEPLNPNEPGLAELIKRAEPFK
jgi:hypothetical protein